MRSTLPALALAATLAAAPVATPVAIAQERPAMLEGAALTIAVEQRVSAKPDIATVTAGVATEAPTAEAALAANAQRMTAVIAAIRRAGVAERDIQTARLSVQPQMVYGENVPPRVSGYQASNTVSVKVRNLANLGKTVDAVVAQGGNQLEGVSFGIDNPDPLLDGARAEAMKKARARAEIYAQAAGLRVARIVAITETGAAPPPRLYAAPMAARAEAFASTPVAPGEVDLTAGVSVTFELK
jgi:uncharacterized protein YggE